MKIRTAGAYRVKSAESRASTPKPYTGPPIPTVVTDYDRLLVAKLLERRRG